MTAAAIYCRLSREDERSNRVRASKPEIHAHQVRAGQGLGIYNIYCDEDSRH